MKKDNIILPSRDNYIMDSDTILFFCISLHMYVYVRMCTLESRCTETAPS